MLVSASWTIRYSVVSTSGGRRSSPSCASSVDSDVGRFGERLHESLERRDRPEVVERLRPQLDGQAADVLQRRHDELTQVGGGFRSSSESPASSTARRPSRIDVSAWPVSSCSSRARRRRSSSWPPTMRRSASRATRRERSTAIAARSANCSASRRSALLKRWSRPSLSCATSTPIGTSRSISGT